MNVNSPTTSSQKPYLIRALYEWIVDNELTPYIEVNTKIEGVNVPVEHIQDNRIILNVSPSAVKELNLGNDWIDFYARFSGIVRLVQVPVVAVLKIYARETGEGTAFKEEDSGGGVTSSSPAGPASTKKGKPTLKIVK